MCLMVLQIFRLLRLLRLYSAYQRFSVRRRIRSALVQAGLARPGSLAAPGTANAAKHKPQQQHQEEAPLLGEEELSVLELELMQDMDRETRVGQKLEGEAKIHLLFIAMIGDRAGA